MSRVTPAGGTSALIGSISDAQPAATSASWTSCTPRTCRQISHTPTSPQAWPSGTGGGPSPSSTWTSLTRPGPIGVAPLVLQHRDPRVRRACRRTPRTRAARRCSRRAPGRSRRAGRRTRSPRRRPPTPTPTWSTPWKVRHAASTASRSRPASTRISRIRRRLSSSVTGSRGRPDLAAGLAEHPHQRLELALVGAELPAPAAGEPELREELVGAPRVLAARRRRRRARRPPRSPASRRAPERAAADEAVATVLEQELEARDAHERAEDANVPERRGASSRRTARGSGVLSLIATTLSTAASRSARSGPMSTLVPCGQL